MTARVLIAEPTLHTDAVCKILGEGVEVTRGPLPTRAALLTAISEVDAVFARLGHRFDAEVLSKARRLRVIATPTTGLTHIDVEAARAARIQILSLKEERELLEDLPATAELTWGLLLAVMRQIVAASRHTASGGWDRDRFWGSELAGKTLGIIGLGRVGRRVATYGHAFGMTVIAFDTGTDVQAPEHVRRVGRDTLLRLADVVTIHAHHDQGQPPILRAQDFDVMKEGCVFVNTSRGELVDEEALRLAISSGRLGGAGLDVLTGEPGVNVRFAALQVTSNVVITPHIGGATHESIEKTEIHMAHKLRKYLDTQNATH